MQQSLAQQTIVVSASEAGGEVRRELIERGVLAAECTASLIALRRALVRGECFAPILFCVTLDGPTLVRHGRTLSAILDDRIAFATHIGAIGLCVHGRLPEDWTTVGCDAIASSVDEAVSLAEQFETRAAANIGGRFAQTVADARVWMDVDLPAGISDSLRRGETRATDLQPPQPQG